MGWGLEGATVILKLMTGARSGCDIVLFSSGFPTKAGKKGVTFDRAELCTQTVLCETCCIMQKPNRKD